MIGLGLNFEHLQFDKAAQGGKEMIGLCAFRCGLEISPKRHSVSTICGNTRRAIFFDNWS
ncbi:MAG: hypothetical protein WKF84_07205, partial [Pyrinomonadaceae bacterium]